jgi:mannitol/fructose-specific phosphotransferase system IIA component (Ntr-type)
MFGQDKKEDDGAQESAGDEESVNILRFLDPACMRMKLNFEPSVADEDENEQQRERRLLRDKEDILQELADILDFSGQIVNPSKFYKDLVHRERKATTGIVPGIAIPHVRSMQVRSFIMGFARAGGDGVPFASLDGSPTRLFFMLASPPYEDKLYLKVYRQFAEMISQEWVVEAFLDAETKQDVLNVMRGFIAS